MSAVRVITITTDELRAIIREELERAQGTSGPAPDKLLPLAEAADLAGISPETLRSYIHAGRVPAKRAGREYRVRLSDVHRAMEPQAPPEVDDSARTKAIIRRLKG